MEKEGDNTNSLEELKEEISFMKQLINSLEDSEARLEEYYKRGDALNFNKTKKFILQLQDKIMRATK